MVEWRIQKRVDEQFQAFVTGFHELIPPDLVSVFDERELELLIGGIADIDVNDWKKHTDYRGYEETSPVIQNFWQVRYTCPRILCLRHAETAVVHTIMGRGTEVASPAVRHRYFSDTGQRVQGPARK